MLFQHHIPDNGTIAEQFCRGVVSQFPYSKLEMIILAGEQVIKFTPGNLVGGSPFYQKSWDRMALVLHGYLEAYKSAVDIQRNKDYYLDAPGVFNDEDDETEDDETEDDALVAELVSLHRQFLTVLDSILQNT